MKRELTKAEREEIDSYELITLRELALSYNTPTAFKEYALSVIEDRFFDKGYDSASEEWQ